MSDTTPANEPMIGEPLEFPAPIPPAPVPGYKTTEFWLTLAATLIAAAMGFLGEINATWAVVAMTLLNALYTLLRSTLKSHQVKVAATFQ